MIKNRPTTHESAASSANLHSLAAAAAGSAVLLVGWAVLLQPEGVGPVLDETRRIDGDLRQTCMQIHQYN